MLRHATLKTLSWAFIAVLLLTGTLFVGGSIITINTAASIKSTWARFEQGRSEKARALNALIKELGYNGLIHHYKNYILRSDPAYKQSARARIGGALNSMETYRSLGTSAEEEKALQQITTVLVSYDEALRRVEALIGQNYAASEIDRAIAIDDTPALSALQQLSEDKTILATASAGTKSKGVIINALRRAIGYGGMIHHFKNFVLRGDHTLIAITQHDLEIALGEIERYEVLDINSAERAALGDIRLVIEAYRNSLSTAVRLTDEGANTATLDRAVKVDDTPAVQGFATLTREIARETTTDAENIRIQLRFVERMAKTMALGGTLLVALLTLTALWLMRSKIIRPLTQMTRAMTQLAQGDLKLNIEATEERNEIGEMARAMEVFKHNAIDSIRSERARSEQEQRYRTVLNTMVDPLITIDEMGTIESFNPAAERMFGYSASEAIGQNVKILMPEPYHSEHDGYLQRYHATGEAHILGIGREVVARRKNGDTLPVELAVSEMWIEEKRMYTGTLRDISERKRSERMKSEFISTVSHELRTPLTSIRGSLGLLTGGAMGELPPQVTSLLKIAANNTERLLLLINDILDIEKIEAGKMAFKFQNIEIMPLVVQALAAIESFGIQHGVRFEITQRADQARAFADPDRLVQVMNNLLSNAAKFSPPDDRIEVAVANRDHAVRISVTDHGPGIPEDFQSKVFEKFTQSDASDTRKTGGTGLGLSISKAIIEKHGGKIDFLSRKGLGTTFYFDLPVTQCIIEEKETHIKRRHGYGTQEHILIVEDDPDVATLLRRMLAESGLDSDIAHNAAQATALLRQHPQRYAAMTLDLNLPDQDGIAFLQELRQKEATRKLPVIIVSATADNRHQLSGSAVGIIDWLQKPIDPQQLQSAIRQSINSERMPRILHVEDDPDVRQLITLMLQDQAEVVAADSIEMAKRHLQEQAFNLVLLDIGMPDGSGLELIRIIEECAIPPQIVIFSAQEVDQALAQHISAALLKSTTSNVDLVKTIRSILAKNPHQAPDP